jgi:hypothetical protein
MNRIGKKLSLKIVDESDQSTELVEETTRVAKGTMSALNWDKDNTVVYVGGFPVEAKVSLTPFLDTNLLLQIT